MKVVSKKRQRRGCSMWLRSQGAFFLVRGFCCECVGHPHVYHVEHHGASGQNRSQNNTSVEDNITKCNQHTVLSIIMPEQYPKFCFSVRILLSLVPVIYIGTIKFTSIWRFHQRLIKKPMYLGALTLRRFTEGC